MRYLAVFIEHDIGLCILEQHQRANQAAAAGYFVAALAAGAAMFSVVDAQFVAALPNDPAARKAGAA